MTHAQTHHPALTVSRRSLLVGAAALAAVPVTGGVAYAGKDGSAAAGPRGGRTVSVVAASTGLTLSRSSVPAGVVTIDVSTTAHAAVGLIRLKPGVSLDKFLADYLLTTSPDPVVKAAAVALIDAEAQYLGGASATAATGSVKSITMLTPGTYYLLNYSAATTPAYLASVARLDVGLPERGDGELPEPDAVFAYYDSGTDGRYLMPDRLPARGTFLVHNQTDQLNEAAFLPLRPGVTDADVAAWVSALFNHTPVPPAPFSDGPAGVAPICSGFSNYLRWSFRPGRYMVTSFMTNRHTRIKRAFEGMYSIVTLD